jgi:hypothetical protein
MSFAIFYSSYGIRTDCNASIIRAFYLMADYLSREGGGFFRRGGARRKRVKIGKSAKNRERKGKRGVKNDGFKRGGIAANGK